LGGKYSNANADRRILRSRQLIVDAFLSLLQDMEYDKINIRDIADRANVNRSTFYAHFVDKDDFLNRIVEEKLTEIAELTERSGGGPLELRPDFNEPDPFYVELFEHLARNETFYRVMLVKMPPSLFQAKMQETIRDCFFRRISGIGMDRKLQVPLDILLDYMSGAAQGIIVKWLGEKIVYSPHYMALQLTRLSILGIYEAAGVRSEEIDNDPLQGNVIL
jgi:AcrR family transcriptional regulator